MPKLPLISGRECVKALQKVGFFVARQRGSHIILDNGQGRTVTVPDHKEIARGTLRSIIKQAGLTEEEFLALL